MHSLNIRLVLKLDANHVIKSSNTLHTLSLNVNCIRKSICNISDKGLTRQDLDLKSHPKECSNGDRICDP